MMNIVSNHLNTWLNICDFVTPKQFIDEYKNHNIDTSDVVVNSAFKLCKFNIIDNCVLSEIDNQLGNDVVQCCLAYESNLQQNKMTQNKSTDDSKKKKIQKKQKKLLDNLEKEYESYYYDMCALFHDECHKVKYDELERINSFKVFDEDAQTILDEELRQMEEYAKDFEEWCYRYTKKEEERNMEYF